LIFTPTGDSSGAILAVDYGLKRVGLAVCDPQRRTAVGIGILKGLTGRALARAVEQAAASRQAATVVIGKPSGAGHNAQLVTGEAERLADALKRAGFQVVRWDEAYTTATALAERRRIGGKGKPSREWVDEAAAVIILGDYLEHIKKARKRGSSEANG
jgi:putative Holliday junction resolvase